MNALIASSELWFGMEPVWVLLAIGAFGLVSVIFKADDGREERRRKALKAYVDLSAIGLDQASHVAAEYAIGGYTELTSSVSKLVEETNNRGADEIARSIVIKTLPGLLRSPEHGPIVLKAIQDAQAAVSSPPGARTPLGTASLG